MADVVYAVMDSEVSVEEEVEGGGVRGEDQSKAEAVVRAEMNPEVEVGGSDGKEESKDAASVDAERNSEASVQEEKEDGGSKGEVESSEDEEEDGESSEASSSSEEEEGSSEASSSSDEEEQIAKKHGGVGDMAALIQEGELMVGINDDDDEEEDETLTSHTNSKHEVEVLPPVPKIEIQLEPHHKALPVGTISSIMGERVIVEGSVQHNPLNEGSILWITESRKPLGIVEELFGPVKNPYYLVRYNSVEEVPAGISAGTAVSFVTEFADHILNVKELYTKGYDESGDHVEDETDDPEFSDDEKEAEYKRSLRMAKRQTDRQFESKKRSGNKRKQPRDAGFHKDMPPRIHNLQTPGHQSKHRFQRSDLAASANNSASLLGPRNISTSLPIMAPSVSVNPAMASAVQFADQKGGGFPNPSQQFLPQQPNLNWPGGFPSPLYPDMGINGAAFAANIMQNILSAANQYQQNYQNQSFGGFPNGMPMAPTQFMPQSRMPANPMPFGGPPVNPPFGPASEFGMGQANPYNVQHLAGNQGQMPPGLPNTQGYGSLPLSHGDGGQYPMQFSSGQFNHGNPQNQGGRHSLGRGGGGNHK
ncbi:H/ACA ribonucleoprotein complex non-core subunit NAF1-like [Lolium rigidum]|uniref:H/ACA ribonucleoprotein complex non-core subunit NAF1-like n=1 Tax=Lolium rigidum TaxID=89674 RepID=UPI001F5D36D3|nr:H/ACA ribonucleoprotein complex non-core subunit NAF1-like [Lolium rigidum]